jgi:DNA polymerase I|tara:strand:+ start:246 stop:1040 length:795 start_codon:yes stop_codon:yes gene_type:complete
MTTSTLLVDGDIILYKVCWAVQTEVEWANNELTSYSDMQELKDTFEADLKNLLEKAGCDKYIICLSDHENNFRKKIYSLYKANRKSIRKPLGYKKLEDYVILNHCCIGYPTLEADDVIGIEMTRLPTDTVAGYTFVTPSNGRRISASIDKDMLTIPGEHYNMDSEEFVVISEKQADYNFYTQVLTGDTVDNYKGCPGVGPKKAADILKQTDYGENWWECIVMAFQKAGLTEEDALLQARMARILRAEDYKLNELEIKLWEPLRA